MVADTHPLFGQLLQASGFTRLNGVLHLIVGLPDGSPGTILAAATDVFGQRDSGVARSIFDVEGLRALHGLVLVMQDRAGPPRRRQERK